MKITGPRLILICVHNFIISDVVIATMVLSIVLALFLFLLQQTLTGKSSFYNYHEKIKKMSNILQSVAGGENSSKEAWELLMTHPEYSFLIKNGEANNLCFMLSQIPRNVLNDGRVKLLLSDLPLYQDTNLQFRCIIDPVSFSPLYYEGYNSFLATLPLINDPKQWATILLKWTELDKGLERIHLLNSVPGLTAATDQTSLLGQFCALDRTRHRVSLEFVRLLPVFRSNWGTSILDRARTHDVCTEFLNHPESKLFQRLISDATNDMLQEIPALDIPPELFNEALGNNLPAEEFIDLIKHYIKSNDIGALFNIIDKSDLLIQSLDVLRVYEIAAFLVNPKVPTDLFSCFFNRAGQFVTRDAQQYRQFLYETLLHTKQLGEEIFTHWYIELTSIHPMLIEQSVIKLPFWEDIIRPRDGPIDLSMYLGELQQNLGLLEFVLAKTKCTTKSPIVSYNKCKALGNLIRKMNISPSEHLQQGFWRIASETNFTIKDLIKYLSDNKHSVPAVAWALSRLPPLSVELARHLAQSSSITVRTLISLLRRLGQRPARSCLGSEVGSPDIVNVEDLENFLNLQQPDGNDMFTNAEKYSIIKSLISLLTNLGFDELPYVAWTEEPLQDTFNNLIKSYCNQYTLTSPAIIAK